MSTSPRDPRPDILPPLLLRFAARDEQLERSQGFGYVLISLGKGPPGALNQ